MSEPNYPKWVPEDYIYDSASECLEKHPDAGPACAFMAPAAYDALAEKLKQVEAELYETKIKLDREKFSHQNCFDHWQQALERVRELERQVELLLPKASAGVLDARENTALRDKCAVYEKALEFYANGMAFGYHKPLGVFELETIGGIPQLVKEPTVATPPNKIGNQAREALERFKK